MKKRLSLLLAFVMAATMLTSCKTDGNADTTDNSATTTTTAGTNSNDNDTSGDDIEISPRPYPTDYNPENDTLLIGTTEFNGVFNYLYYSSQYDRNIVDLVSAGVYNTGPGGQLIEGACFYQVPEISYDDAGNPTGAVYTFRIKKGVTFSDGTPVTADDLIFTYKAMCDPMYEGLASIYTLSIPGIKEYRYDDPNYEEKIAAIEEEAKNVTDEEVMVEVHAMSVADYEDAGYGPEGLIGDLGLEIDASLEAGSDEYKEAVIAAADEAYFSIYYDYFAGDVIASKQSRLMKEYVQGNLQGGANVPEIEGIKKIDEYTVQITCTEVDPTAESQLAGYILPEHYYGKDYVKGDMESIRALNSAPLGAGMYIFESYKDGVVTLRSNPNYYEGEPIIKTLKFQELPSENDGMFNNAMEKAVDVVDVSCTPENVEALENAGLYCMIYDYNGWGYVGVNSTLISDINVRKGLMHIMNRNPAVESYYGDYADVLERPITQASWGYPTGADEYYGYDKTKALEFFEKAGYTNVDGKLVNASGEQLTFDAYPSSNTHPVVPLFTQMKLDLEEMGAVFNIEQLDWATYNEMYQQGKLAIWAAAYGGGAPDPDCYQYFHSDMIATNNNPFHINDTKVDELILKGRTILDSEERKPIYRELFDAVMETAGVMPYYNRKMMYTINPDIVDLDYLIKTPDPFYGFFENIFDLRLK